MIKVLQWIGTFMVLLVVLLLVWNSWQAGVNIFADSCETDSGRALPQTICRTITHYRYLKSD